LAEIFISIIITMPKQSPSIKIVDLVEVCRQDRHKFERLFKQAQKIYHASFRSEEKESTACIRRFIWDAARDSGDGSGYRFCYLIPLLGKRVGGMFMFEMIPLPGKSLMAFLGYIAVDRSLRGMGIAKRLIQEFRRFFLAQAKQYKLKPLGGFGEVEKPDLSVADDLRNKIRPGFHHNVCNFGVMTVLTAGNRFKILPYFQPGISRNRGAIEPPVPFLPCIMRVFGKTFRKLPVGAGKVVDHAGQLKLPIKSLPVMNSAVALQMIHGVYNSYREGAEYSKNQIDKLEDNIRRNLEGYRKVYIVPIPDTAYIPLK